MLDQPLVLLPAAGFGTRVGSPNSKEILKGPGGGPLIETALKQAQLRGWPVHVITRKEKTELIQYLERYRKDNELEIEIQIIEPSKEWPDSILRSRAYWRPRNLLCLPDTIFSPLGIWDSLVQSQVELSVAVFQPHDFSKWGVIKLSESGVEICEKPQTNHEGMRAWGLMSFQPKAGEVLLKAQLESTFNHQWYPLDLKAELFSLDQFEDLTRST